MTTTALRGVNVECVCYSWTTTDSMRLSSVFGKETASGNSS